MYKNLYAEPREEKAQAALFKGQEYFEQDAFEQALNSDSIGYTGFLKVADEYSGTKAEMCIRDRNIANTRMKIAQLLGYKDYAEYTLKKRMAENSESVSVSYTHLDVYKRQA